MESLDCVDGFHEICEAQRLDGSVPWSGCTCYCHPVAQRPAPGPADYARALEALA